MLSYIKTLLDTPLQTHIGIIRVIHDSEEYTNRVIPQIAGGEHYGIGLKEDGTVWTWGYDESGLAEFNVPSNSNIITTYKSVAAGPNFAVALRENGSVWTVGNNEYGQLGIGTTESKSKFVEIEGLSGIVKVTAGNNYVIALDKYGRMKWT